MPDLADPTPPRCGRSTQQGLAYLQGTSEWTYRPTASLAHANQRFFRALMDSCAQRMGQFDEKNKAFEKIVHPEIDTTGHPSAAAAATGHGLAGGGTVRGDAVATSERVRRHDRCPKTHLRMARAKAHPAQLALRGVEVEALLPCWVTRTRSRQRFGAHAEVRQNLVHRSRLGDSRKGAHPCVA